MNCSMVVALVLIFGLVAVHAGFTGYGFGNAGFQPGGGISNGAHGYGARYNTYGTNNYYGGGVGGGYGYHG